jgi:hypothetical protein
MKELGIFLCCLLPHDRIIRKYILRFLHLIYHWDLNYPFNLLQSHIIIILNLNLKEKYYLSNDHSLP